MLTSEFNVELSVLIRALQQRVLMEPALTVAVPINTQETIEHIDRAIVSLIATRFALQGRGLD